MKKILIFLILINFNILHADQIIRDHVFEQFLEKKLLHLTKENLDFRLINSDKNNAFVIDNNYIFFTKGLFNNINNEDVLTSIMLHEYGHILKKHLFKKKN